MDDTPTPDAIAEAIVAFVNTSDWGEARQIVEENRALLLDPSADVIFRQLLDAVQDNPDKIRVLVAHQTMLRWCRRYGIDEAFRRAEEGDATAPQPQDVADAIYQFVNTSDWDEAQAVAEAYKELLLHPHADDVFEAIIAAQGDDGRTVEVLRKHQTVLRWCREDGLSAGFERARQQQVQDDAISDLISQAVLAFVNTNSWDEAQQVVEEHQAVLLHPAADQVLEQVIATQEDESAIEILRSHRTVLQWCREVGIDMAFRRVQDSIEEQDSSPSIEELTASVFAFVNTADWTEARSVVESQSDLLLRPDIDLIFAAVVQTVANDEAKVRVFQMHQLVLQWCREDGIETAFERAKKEFGQT